MARIFMEKRGRDRLYVIVEILDVATQPTPKTAIMHKANLSFSQLNDYLPLLLETELLQKVEHGKRQLYKTTSKGHEYLESYREVIDTLGGSSSTVRVQSTLLRVRSALRSFQDSIKMLEIALSGLSECPFCKEDVLPDFRFCPQCGKTLTKSTVVESPLKKATK